MWKVFQIYKNDWVNVFKTPIALFLIIALMILPSLYAWFNLKASWDPYGNTSHIPIAVTNADEGAVLRGKNIDVGKEIVNTLKKNNALGWTFVSEEKAAHGLEHGDYYATIYIPKDFSKRITTLLDAQPKKPEIIYSVNEKINAIAPKITSKGASTITENVSSNFVKTVSKAVLTEFNKIGIELQRELPTILKMENLLFELEKHLPDIQDMGNKALEFEKKLPEIRKQGQKIIALEKMLPEINQSSKQILKLEDKLPELKNIGNEIVTLQTKLPDIQKAANKVTEIDQHFDTIQKGIQTALDDTAKAQKIIQAAQGSMPKVEQVVGNGKEMAAAANDFLNKSEATFASMIPIVKQNLLLLKQTADTVNGLTNSLKDNSINPESALQMSQALDEQLTNGINEINRTIEMFTRINENMPNKPLTGVIQKLWDAKAKFEQQLTLDREIEVPLKEGKQPNSQLVSQLNQTSQQASQLLNNILDRYDSEIAPNITQGYKKLIQVTKDSASVLNTAQDKLPDIKQILQDSAKVANFGYDRLKQLQQDLPDIEKKLHETIQKIRTAMPKVVQGVNAAADFFQKDFPKLEPKIHKAADFVRNDLPGVENDIRRVAELIRTKLPEVEEATHKIANLVRNDLPDLEKAVKNAANKVRKFNNEENLGDIIELLKNDINKESDFLANPVLLKEHKVFPIPNYGSANSPFYTTLSLWVGALLLISLLRVDVENRESFYSPYHEYFGRFLTFATIGLFQALIVTLGDLFLLKAYVADKVPFILSGIFISFVFMSIVYTLVSIFGNVGKGLAIILLVLQISGSGGTFPIQVTPPFFRAINPFLPFTYAINLMRETVGGMVHDLVIHNILFLLLFLIIGFALGILLKKPLAKHTEKIAELAKKSKLIH
ncbi:YhgE/Pip domain-containing protein [Heyndrickxia sporothermodurans]|uniref:YhgE/Pip domain-containing protein n=1 Tax=Heyndrickxia sporothermodurans TaxID=46224 RepID=UPI002DBEBB1E|nr:YhgE/Pip domain-containing protein [Heyndrickxia sporothermodurans]MEB6549767.1 YhgE/Pip domain-containing protein [Heyndrickxia sporothermodurans]